VLKLVEQAVQEANVVDRIAVGAGAAETGAPRRAGRLGVGNNEVARRCLPITASRSSWIGLSRPLLRAPRPAVGPYRRSASMARTPDNCGPIPRS
jgi:hypothetical protein